VSVVIRKILAATDFSPASEGALRWADFLASRLGAELVLFHAFSLDPALLAGPTGVAVDLASRLLDEVRRAAEESMRELQTRFPRARAVIEQAPAREGIVRAAHAQQADLVCVGTHGRTGLPRLLQGSVAQHVVVHSPVPVLTVRQDDRPARLRCILAPTDFSPPADAALPWADFLARAFDARLVLLHVVEVTYETILDLPRAARAEPVGEALARELQERARRELESRAQSLGPCELVLRTGLGAGLSRQTIVEVAQEVDADLVVIGTHGRTGVERILFGSVAEHVVRTSPVPVLTVRQPRSS
jgi:nucleotide-binding universal stress UspA family protein